MYKIYKHTLKEGFDHTGWSYIGQTGNDLGSRWQNGFGYKKCILFWRAIKKYGWDNFKHEILEDNLTLAEANEKEEYYIAKYHTWIDDPKCKGYNLKPGGYNNELAKETKQRISKALQGHSVSESARKIFSENLLAGKGCYKYWSGKTRSKETKEKLSEAGKLRKPTKETKQKTSNSLFSFYRNKSNNKIRKDGTWLSRSVLCIETGEVFFSANEASRQKSYKHSNTGAGHIKDACTGIRKSAFGYHWQYLDD